MGGTGPVTVTSSDAGLTHRLLGDASFGKYTLIAKIGHGGMAEVFLAAVSGPAGFTKLCVLKRLHPHLEEEPALIGMFLDEARLAARLNHPNVVQTYEVGDVEGLHFLTMEYLEGQSLARVLRHLRRLEQPMPLAVGVRLFIEVLDGLQYAHGLTDFDGTPLNVIHRDISPGNIFVTYDGQVKVLDFGIARAGTQLVETRAGQVKGKFAYIAPEQANPDGGYDQRADLWSLGVVMWEAFANQRLFKGESEIVTLHNALNSQVLSLDQEFDVPERLAEIVDRALQRDPEDRYASARAMKQELEQFMVSEGLRASRNEVGTFLTGLFERERDEQRRVLRAYMRGDAPGQSMTPVPSSGSHSGISRSGATSSTMTAAPEEEERRPAFWIVGLLLLLAIAGGAAFAFLGGDEESPGDEPRIAAAPGEVGGGSSAGLGAGEGPGEGDEALGGSATGAETQVTPDPETATPDPETAPEGPDDGEEGGDDGEATAGSESGQPSAEANEGDGEEDEPEVRRTTPMRRTRPRPRPRPRPTPMETASVMEAPPPEPTPQREDGFLTIDTVPWSNVSLGSRRLGTTPVVRERLPAGTHVLTLTNPEQGLRTSYRVTIEPGETTTRRIALQ
ncbi:MAG TPA: serine/threonine-protein kinase [Polyangiaceae bacterium LLY-WYZ-15_(1-7)]|mgnify:CR=1 FL=1|nr:hypothetical protein [Myxococcales bacterium]MAT28987.1 hypothetical protein [Sandaracinus sp.]HJK95042.1 serine/threonine-protein kinase [Polyangiaceae bacterium LLY-WYZ-15_(1-7)]HJL04214.1 serine/threonine-protein kinase [Polyangiaceae bacterium LLY-WYZ-15_(1-7)]HJL08943.1 serine/threonine-protein kinase [Polyangiaceae bacterium LLY-WYZ-15_(1-7)]